VRGLQPVEAKLTVSFCVDVAGGGGVAAMGTAIGTFLREGGSYALFPAGWTEAKWGPGWRGLQEIWRTFKQGGC